jgi:hypothetical protein
MAEVLLLRSWNRLMSLRPGWRENSAMAHTRTGFRCHSAKRFCGWIAFAWLPLAGHTHGGQIRIPAIGIITNASSPVAFASAVGYVFGHAIVVPVQASRTIDQMRATGREIDDAASTMEKYS